MSIVDDVLHELPAWRQQAESLMVDTGAAKRPSGRAYNSSTQVEDDTYTALFTSACKINARNVAALTQEVGARTATTVRLELHLPVTTAALTVGDLWMVTATAETSTAVVGTVYRVTAPVDGSLRTANRYEIERVVS